MYFIRASGMRTHIEADTVVWFDVFFMEQAVNFAMLLADVNKFKVVHN